MCILEAPGRVGLILVLLAGWDMGDAKEVVVGCEGDRGDGEEAFVCAGGGSPV